MITKPIPPAPIKEEDKSSTNWTRWFNLISSNSVKIYDVSTTVSPVNIPAQTTQSQSVGIVGIDSSDKILSITKPTVTSGIGIVGFRVKAKNLIEIDFANFTAGNITPPSEIYTFVLIK